MPPSWHSPKPLTIVDEFISHIFSKTIPVSWLVSGKLGGGLETIRDIEVVHAARVMMVVATCAAKKVSRSYAFLLAFLCKKG